MPLDVSLYNKMNMMEREFVIEALRIAYPSNTVNSVVPFTTCSNDGYEGTTSGFDASRNGLWGWHTFSFQDATQIIDFYTFKDDGTAVILSFTGAFSYGVSQTIFGLFHRVVVRNGAESEATWSFVGWKTDEEVFVDPSLFENLVFRSLAPIGNLSEVIVFVNSAPNAPYVQDSFKQGTLKATASEPFYTVVANLPVLRLAAFVALFSDEYVANYAGLPNYVNGGATNDGTNWSDVGQVTPAAAGLATFAPKVYAYIRVDGVVPDGTATGTALLDASIGVNCVQGVGFQEIEGDANTGFFNSVEFSVAAAKLGGLSFLADYPGANTIVGDVNDNFAATMGTWIDGGGGYWVAASGNNISVAPDYKGPIVIDLFTA